MAGLNLKVSNKHIQIDKANSLMLIATATTTVIVVFSLVAAQSLFKQLQYQNKVIGLRNTANKQLAKNIAAVDSLKTVYDAFENSTESALGTSDKNSKIILDALPSKYDFPALTSSLEGVINGSGSAIATITGTDEEVNAEQDSINPKPINIPFEYTAKSSFTNAQKLIADMQRSIRPFHVSSLSLTGTDTDLNVKVTGKTYYQPEKQLEIEQKIIPGTDAKKTTVKATQKTTGAK